MRFLVSTDRCACQFGLSLLVALAAGLGLNGCGGGSEVKGLTPVSGTVTYKGQPLTSGVVTFVPKEVKGGDKASCSGNIDATGHYEIMTGINAPGVAPGEYQIRIESWETPPSMGEKGAMNPGKSAIPVKYSAARASGLTATVEGSSKTVDLKLE